MTMVNRIERHTDLMHGMADTVGVDLGDALLDGRLAPDELRSAVLRCTGCEAAEVCGQWLADNADSNPDAAPGYCRNADLFARLQD